MASRFLPALHHLFTPGVEAIKQVTIQQSLKISKKPGGHRDRRGLDGERAFTDSHLQVLRIDLARLTTQENLHLVGKAGQIR